MSRLRAYRKRLRRRWKHRPGLVPWLAYQPTRLLLFVASKLPYSWSRGLGRWGGRLAWCFARRRRAGREQIAAAFPDMPAAERDRILKRSCATLGESAVETMIGSVRIRDSILDGTIFEGDAEEVLLGLKGKGAILVQAHLGAFEYGGARMARLGLDPAFPMRMPNNFYLSRRLQQAREGWGVTLLPKRGAVRPMMKHLKAGGSVVLATDQNAHQSPIFAHWFGRLAATERAASALTLKLGVPLVVFWCVRGNGQTDRRIGCRLVRDSCPPQAADDAAARELTEQIHRVLEDAIRRYPEQYLWIHDRYRTRPQDRP